MEATMGTFAVKKDLAQMLKGGDVQVISRLPDGRIVAARQGKWLATSFHPELTRDDRFHHYFASLAG